MPITAISVSGKRLFSPSAAIASPPTPKNSIRPLRRLAQRTHQLDAELVARRLARHER